MAGLALAGCSGPSLEVLERKPAEFLERRERELYLDNRPYRYLSFTAFTLTGCGVADEVPSAGQLDAFFASLRPQSLVRTYAFEAQGMPAIERVVEAARARRQLLTLVLSDDAGECGDGGTKKTNEWYAGEFRNAYLPWVQTIVSRFKNDPTVGMWEPIKAPVEVDILTLRTFYDVVGGEIRRIDPNHLLESGSHGPWAYGGDSNYALIHESAGIDVASFHDYDNQSDAPPNLEPSLRAAASLSKPVILGEMGMFASENGDPSQQFGSMPCKSWVERRDAFARQLGAAFRTRLSGVNIWNWFPVSKQGCALSTHPSDPLVALVRDFPVP